MPDPGESGETPRLQLAGAALFYTAIAALLFGLQLGGRVSTHAIGSQGDRLEFIWNAWWIDQSLLSLRNPYFTDLIFAPAGTPLVWHSLVPLTSCVMAVLRIAFETTPAYNLIVFLAFPLAGTGAWVLCRYVVRDLRACLVGGLVFMLCPFIASKAMGHLNLLYCGFLPIFYLCLLRSIEDRSAAGRRKYSWWLAGSSLALFLSSMATVVFAANLAFFTAIWWWRRAGARDTATRFARAFAPAVLVTAPIVAVFAWYTLAYDGLPERRHSYSYNPELLSYVLPLTETSAHRGHVADLAAPSLAGIEQVAYLGWLVAPLCIAGFVLARARPHAQLAAALFAVFFALSFGPKLLWNREVVELAGLPIYLPFGIWRHVPLLGAVGQAGRYLVVSYMVMAIGAAYFLARANSRVPPRWRTALAALCGALVLIDYAIVLPASPLPPMAPLADRPGAVVDLRPSSLSLYYQTVHGRKIVGGAISRPPQSVLAEYDEVKTFAWLRDAGRETPSKGELLADLARYGVGDISVDPGSVHEATLNRYGFAKVYADSFTSIWADSEMSRR